MLLDSGDKDSKASANDENISVRKYSTPKDPCQFSNSDSNRGIDVWIKPLVDGSNAVGIYNTGEPQGPVTVQFRDLGLGKSATLREVWEGKDLGRLENSFTVTVPTHGVVLIKVK